MGIVTSETISDRKPGQLRLSIRQPERPGDGGCLWLASLLCQGGSVDGWAMRLGHQAFSNGPNPLKTTCGPVGGIWTFTGQVTPDSGVL